MSDQLFSRHRFRLLTLVDNFSRESLAIEAGQCLTGDDVVRRILEQVCAVRGLPRTIHVDNGPEFISRSLGLWANWNKVQLDSRRPGNPTGNAVTESFNGTVRDECLNQHSFLSLNDAQTKLQAWRTDYNECRPHSSPGNHLQNNLQLNSPQLGLGGRGYQPDHGKRKPLTFRMAPIRGQAKTPVFTTLELGEVKGAGHPPLHRKRQQIRRRRSSL